MEIRYVDDILWNRILSKNISTFYIRTNLYETYIDTYVYIWCINRTNYISHYGCTMSSRLKQNEWKYCNNMKVLVKCVVAFYWIKDGFMAGNVERNNHLRLLLSACLVGQNILAKSQLFAFYTRSNDNLMPKFAIKILTKFSKQEIYDGSHKFGVKKAKSLLG